MTSEQAARAIVYARSQGRCELCQRPAESVHHRMKQGRPWDPAGLLHLCGDGTRRCHHWIENHPEMAMVLGLWVPRGHDPAVYPVWCWPTMWYRTFWQLDNDGMLHFVHHPHPEPDRAREAMESFATARRSPLVRLPYVCV